MSKMNILALDLGTKTGWALSTNGLILFGRENFQADRFSGGGMRFLKFQRWLDNIHTIREGITEICFEEVRRHLGTDAAHVYGGMLAVLTSWCEDHKIPYQGVPVKTIKKHMTDNGGASKKEVIAAVREKGHETKDDNEADAIALLYWRLSSESESFQ